MPSRASARPVLANRQPFSSDTSDLANLGLEHRYQPVGSDARATGASPSELFVAPPECAAQNMSRVELAC